MTFGWQRAVAGLALAVLSTGTAAQDNERQTGLDLSEINVLQQSLSDDLLALETELRAFPSAELEGMVADLKRLLNDIAKLQERLAEHDAE